MGINDFYKFAQSAYHEYCNFILPNILPSAPDIVLDDHLPDRGTHHESQSGSKITLNPKLLIEYSDSGKGIIFHDFTHFFDHATLVLELPLADRQVLLSHYTEFHAAFVQMQCWCGFRSIDETKNIELHDRIPYKGSDISICDFYIEEAKTARNLTMLYSTTETPDSFSRLVKRAMYFAAEMWFAKKYATFDLGSFFDPSVFSLYLGDVSKDFVTLFMTDVKIDEATMWESVSYVESMKEYASTINVLRRRQSNF